MTNISTGKIWQQPKLGATCHQTEPRIQDIYIYMYMYIHFFTIILNFCCRKVFHSSNNVSTSLHSLIINLYLWKINFAANTHPENFTDSQILRNVASKFSTDGIFHYFPRKLIKQIFDLQCVVSPQTLV